MGTYAGRLWLARRQSEKLEVQILLDEETIRITSNGTLIGDWPMFDVDVEPAGDVLHLFVEAEQLVIDPHDPDLVNELMGVGQDDDDVQEPEPQHPKRSRKGAHRADRRMRWKW